MENNEEETVGNKEKEDRTKRRRTNMRKKVSAD